MVLVCNIGERNWLVCNFSVVEMKVYYRRITTWQKWPDNDLVDEDYISYSLSKKKWNEFHRTDPLPNVKDRQISVGAALRVKPANIDLTKPF